MAISTELEILNHVLRDLSSCFLQYVGEVWPWTSAGPEGDRLLGSVMQCVERQRESIGLIADYLAPRQDRVEFGHFSAEFTDLHYVSLQFLLKRLIAGQKQLVESIDRSNMLSAAVNDSHEILQKVSDNERANLAALQAL